MIGKAEIARAAYWARDRYSPVVVYCQKRDAGFFAIRGVWHVLSGSAGRNLLDRLLHAGGRERELSIGAISDEDRRQFASAAGLLCGVNGQKCSACLEEEILQPLGITSLDALGK